MNVRTLHTGFWICSAFFLCCIFLAFYFQILPLLLVPVGVVAFYLILQKPVLLFYGLLVSIPWSAPYYFSSALGTDLPDEPLMALTAAAVVLYLVYNRKRWRNKGWLHPLVVALLVQFLWMIITVIYSSHLLFSIKYSLAKSWYVLAFAGAPALFFSSKKDIKTAGLLLLSSMSVLVSFIMVRHGRLGFTFDAINESVSPYFHNHVNYSALLVCMVPLLVVFYKSASQRWVKGLLLFLFLITLAAIYLSYARGAWLAFVIGISVYFLLAKGWLMPAFFTTLILCAIGVFYLQHNDRYLAFAPKFKTTIFHTDFREHLIATYEGKDVSTAERFYRWAAGANMVKEKPMIGFGPNTFAENYWSYTVPAFKTWVSNNKDRSTVHNYFLLLLIEQGIPGLLFFLFLIGYAFYRAQIIFTTGQNIFYKKAAACIAVILAMVCTVNFLSDLIETDKIGSVFYTCIGVVIFIDNQQRKSQLAANV